MLRVLIPVIDKDGALQAARHAVFLFAEHCVSEVEVVEVLDPPDALEPAPAQKSFGFTEIRHKTKTL